MHGPTPAELAASREVERKAAAAAAAAALASPRSPRSAGAAGAGPGGRDIELSNGVCMPAIGFGIADSLETLEVALSAGYRLLDTARIYRGGDHELDIGAVLNCGRWDREQIFVTTKTSSYGPQDNTYMWDPAVDAKAGVLAEFDGCLVRTQAIPTNLIFQGDFLRDCLWPQERLQMDKVDLLLLHWPGPPPAGIPDRPNVLTPEQHVEKRLAMWRALEEVRCSY